MGESLRKLLAIASFICLCGLTYLLFTNPYICEGVTGPLLPVAESKAAEQNAFWLTLSIIATFGLTLFLSPLFRFITIFLAAVCGVEMVIRKVRGILDRQE